MNPPRKKLPLGIQTLSEIISDGYYYADKTRQAHQLATRGKFYFLSRPRRFGKSLLLDTLKELFEANEPLFKGLHIHGLWDWAVRHPVIQISFNEGGVKDCASLARRIRGLLEDNAARLGLECPNLDDPEAGFRRLIHSAREKHGQRVVVLVDEYDKPILDNLHHTETAAAIRDALKDFYSVIKAADADIRFAIVTGISKFSKVSLFSGLNNLDDITLHPAYSAICGYTEADLDTVFAPELEGLDRGKIRHWYNGYNWLGEAVYNPFDLLRLFELRVFKSYWFETGTPGFLVKLMAQHGFFTPDLARLRSDEELISSFDPENMAPEALLFQTGFLTIGQTEELPSGDLSYTLRYPNREVETSLNASLLSVYTDGARKSGEHRYRLGELLLAADTDGLRALFTAFFSSIPHQWYAKNPISNYEGYYASVFYTYFAALGYPVLVEDATNHGRIDMAVRLPGRVFLFEFKVVELAPKGSALRQLKERGYAEKYRVHGVPIHLVGVEFSRRKRNVVGFEVENA